MERTIIQRRRFMRLYNTYYICKTCLPMLENTEWVEVKNGSSLLKYKIKGWEDCKVALDELYNISCLKDDVFSVYSVFDVISKESLAPELSPDSGRKFISRIGKLRDDTKIIINLYDSMNIGEATTGIDVKIPKCESLQEYMDYLKEINFIFTQCPYLISKDEEIKFNSVDVGSQWLTFVLITAGTLSILNNLAGLIDKALAIKSHLITIRQQEEMLETMKSNNEATQEVLDVFKTMKHLTMEGFVKDLEDELGELKDGEERGKVEKTLEKLSNLIEKGVEIYSSIDTPNEVKALFPMNENNPILPDNIIKLLEEKDLPQRSNQDSF